jgi:anti-anti-sigma factor
LEIRQSRFGEYLVLHAAGRVDIQTSEAFQLQLLAVVAEQADVIIDFVQVDYISSAGFRALMTFARQMPKDRRIAVVGLNDIVRELFAIARFHHVIPIFDTAEEAADTWGSAAQPRSREQPVPDSDASIRVRFWGTRGSLPAPIGHAAVRAKIRAALAVAEDKGMPSADAIDAFIDRHLPFSVRGTFGGNTSCVEIGAAGNAEYVLCDLGSGAREFGNQMLAKHGPGWKAVYNVFMSHLHWDHIMGFPFFTPSYIPGNTIRFHGCHKELQQAMQLQQSAPCFPIDFAALGANIEFVQLEPGERSQVAGFAVLPFKQPHSGDSYGYRFSRGGKSIVYSTDAEHKAGAIGPDYPYVDFVRDADLLIFDAMYSLADSISVKEDWGHSNNMIAVELAQLAGVKRLALFHHEPVFDDHMIERVLVETMRFEEISRNGQRVEVISAFDGMELTV